MPLRFNGNEVTLYLEEAVSGTGLSVWGCCRTLSLTDETEMLELTPLTGSATRFIPTFDSSSIDANGLYVLPEYGDTVLASKTLKDWQKSHSLLNWMIIAGDLSNYIYDQYSGQAYISTSVGDFNNDEPAGMTIKLICTGAVGNSSPIDPDEPPYSVVCPSVTFTPADTSLGFSFTAPAGVTSIVYLLYKDSTVVKTATLTPPFATPISISATGLISATAYDLELTFNNSAESYTKECNYSSATTGAISGGFGVNPGAACSMMLTAPTTLYSAGAFATGVTIYTDIAMTTPLTGYSYIMNGVGTEVYLIDSATGIVGLGTDIFCD